MAAETPITSNDTRDMVRILDAQCSTPLSLAAKVSIMLTLLQKFIPEPETLSRFPKSQRLIMGIYFIGGQSSHPYPHPTEL